MKFKRFGTLAAATLFAAAACQSTPGGSGAASGGASVAPSVGGTSTAPSTAPSVEPSTGGTPTDTAPSATTGSGGDLGSVTIPAGEPLHLAFWGVLSGADSSLGIDAQRGAEIAVADRGELLGHQLELTSEDGLCTPEGGATAAQKLAADTTIVGLIGSVCSDETVGGIATLTSAGLTTISPSNTRPALTDPARDATYAGYLRTAHSDAIQGDVAAQFVYNELGLTKAATIHDGSAYAEALAGVFADSFEALGGTITVKEAVSKGQTDMSTVLQNVAATEPELLYFPVFVAEGGFIAAQSADVAGLEDVALMGADGIFSQDFIDAAGENVNGMYLSSPDFTAFQSEYEDFKTKYNAEYGEAPISVFHAHAYDAANILMNAIEEVGVDNGGELTIDRQALRDAVYATTDHQGITGTLSCSDSGDCSAPLIAVYQIEDSTLPTAPIWSPPAP